MKTYNVKAIAEMLNTNPETVRRWIRDKKLEATLEAKKTGHVVCESALQTFLTSSPKYAAVFTAATLSAVASGGVLVQKAIDVDRLKKARVSEGEIIKFLQAQIDTLEITIKAKKESIEHLEAQIKAERKQAEVYRNLLCDLEKS